jgi:hypothetical protein
MADKASELEEQPTPKTPPCTGYEVGFLPLKEAVNLVVGAPNAAKMNAGNRTLWQKAISPHRDWSVQECQRDGARFVHVGDFLQWVLSNRSALPEAVELWTPETLAAECARLENARNRPDCTWKDQKKIREEIKLAEGLLRRFAAVGLEAPITNTQTNEDGGDGRRDKQIHILLETIKRENMNPLAIPRGGKSKLKALCTKCHSKEFTESSFDHSWKEAKKRGLIELENPEQYR